MARLNHTLLAPVAAAGTQYSNKLDIAWAAFASFQFFWTGTVTGTITVWVSDKESPNEANDTDWTDLGLTITSPGGAAGNSYNDVKECGARWIRAKHVYSGGAGNIEIWAAAKGAA